MLSTEVIHPETPPTPAELAALSGARGAVARQSLMMAAIKIFAANGYAKASTREICREAGVNVAAIHYYFQDKAGLYRAVFLFPVEEIIAASKAFADPALRFDEAMQIMFGAFLAPFKQSVGSSACSMSDHVLSDALESAQSSESSKSSQTKTSCKDAMRDALRLHLRESFEPSGVLGDALPRAVTSQYLAIQAVLCRQLGLTEADEDIQALALTLVGMVCDYMMSADVHAVVAPALYTTPDAVDRVQKRFVRYASALLAAEIARRAP